MPRKPKHPDRNVYRISGDTAVLTIRRYSGQTVDVVLDADDVPEVRKRVWRVLVGNQKKRYIVSGDVREGDFGFLHHQIKEPPEGMQCGFRNGDTLDCRRDNLMVGSHFEQTMKQARFQTNGIAKTGIPGITYRPDTETWRVVVYSGGEACYVGTYKTISEAIEAQKRAA